MLSYPALSKFARIKQPKVVNAISKKFNKDFSLSL
jgi:hypothetical protein